MGNAQHIDQQIKSASLALPVLCLCWKAVKSLKQVCTK